MFITSQMIGRITSGERYRPTKKIKAMKSEDSSNDAFRGLVEMDTRADTCCLGKNFRHLDDTGDVCNVSGFHGDFKQLKDISIVRAATAWKDETTGKKYIIIINQGLWFGDSMDHSLWNPNQIRHSGISVSDDPYDSTRKFGIDHDEVFIPFNTLGSTVCIETYKPSQEEVDDPANTTIELTSKIQWDPRTVVMSANRPYGVATVKQGISVMAAEVSPSQDGMYFDEFDCHLGQACAATVPYVAADRMIAKVQVATDLRMGELRRISQVASTPRPVIINEIPNISERPVTINETFSTARHSNVSAERVSKVFGIGLGRARQTLRVTTQAGIRRTNPHQGPLTRRYPRSTRRFESEEPRLPGKWYMDWVAANVKSINDDTGAFFIGNGRGFIDCFPRPRHTSEFATDALNEFMINVGTPERLMCDYAKEFCGHKTPFVKNARKRKIDLVYAEGHRHELGPVDVQIRESKKKWQESHSTKDVPTRLWPYGLKTACEIMQVTAQENGRTGFEGATGNSPDIGELLDFEFYDPVWYWRGVHASVGEHAKDFGRYLGVARKVGTGMTYFILTRSGKVIAESSVQHVTREDMENPDIRRQFEQFNTEVKNKLNDENFKLETADGENNLADPSQTLSILARIAQENQAEVTDDIGNSPEMQRLYETNVEDSFKEDAVDADGNPMTEHDQLDALIGATIKVEGPSGTTYGKVTRRAMNDQGHKIGKPHKNPLLDTREYDVELTDGTHQRYQANVIAENIFAQVDDDGRETLVLEEICGHRTDGNAIPLSRGTTLNKSGEPRKKITTAGWHIKVRWTDGSTDELPLSVVKESNPIELAEYAIIAGIAEQPAFAWWINHALRCRDRIIKRARVIKKSSKYWRTKSKFGIDLPHTVEEALQMDLDNGNTFWRDALAKEMKNVRVAFKPYEGNHTPAEVRKGLAKDLIGFTEIKCHIVFDVKMDFTRKARFVAGGHTTEAPACMTYSSVVSRDSVRLAFLIAGLNDLEVSACDVGNAYLNADCREKVWFEAGLECGIEDKGKVMIIEKALYGLKSSGAAWRAMFSDFVINQLHFRSTIVDPDVYIKKSYYVDSNGNTNEYYELLLVYVDDVLLISKNPKDVMEKIGETFRLKDGYGEPTNYLGAEIFKTRREDGGVAWALGSGKYVKNLVEQVKSMLDEEGRTLKKVPNAESKQEQVGPMHPDYKPELDSTPLLNAKLHQRYQQIVGGLRWAVEIGRIDIQIDVAILSQYLAAPREGHLEAVYDVIRYLSVRPDRRLLMSPAKAEYASAIEKLFNNTADWSEFYGEMVEEDPPGMPKPLGTPVKIKTLLDADHAGNVVTRRSHTGILIFVNNALIVQYSKKQNTVESATFGAEMVAMRVARDLTVALRIKLKMFGVPIDGPADFFCDNDSVVKNTSIPTSTLAKKHNSVNYHIIRESAAAGILRVAKIPTDYNTSDALTKVLPMYKRNNLLNPVLHYPSELNIIES